MFELDSPYADVYDVHRWEGRVRFDGPKSSIMMELAELNLSGAVDINY